MKTAVAEVPDFFIFYEGMQSSIPHRPEGFRIGLYVFQCLRAVRPDVAESIRITTRDPRNWTDDEWPVLQDELWDRVIELWEQI